MGKKLLEGFTLIELLVLMMVIGLALGLGVPAFSAMMANARMSAAANELMASIHVARSEASARGRSVTLCATSGWSAEAPTCEAGAHLLAGWIVFEDGNANATVDEGEEVLHGHGPLDDSIALHERTLLDVEPPHYLSFRADGPLQDIGAGPSVRQIQLCDARGDVATGSDGSEREIAAGRWITLRATGRPQLHRLRAEVQGNPLGGC
jgi:type IV fimbrial biogenesis protein FimT